MQREVRKGVNRPQTDVNGIFAVLRDRNERPTDGRRVKCLQ